MNEAEVNSKSYWEHRFATDWGAVGGAQQTGFFAEMALRLLPDWMHRELRDNSWTFIDIGCAEGEGAAYVKRRFPNLDVVGLDFSNTAVITAAARYPEVRFEVADLRELDYSADVLFCSNVLEHFYNPLPLMERMASLAGRYLIVVVPGWEFKRHPEHHVTFDFSQFPVTLGQLTLAHVGAINCARIDERQWPGYQIAVVYERLDQSGRTVRTAADFVSAGALPALTRSDVLELSSFDSSLMAHAFRGGEESVVSGMGALIARVEVLAKRQEEIGYNTRVELKTHIDDAILKVVRPDELVALRASLDESIRLNQVLDQCLAEDLKKLKDSKRENEEVLDALRASELKVLDLERTLASRDEEYERVCDLLRLKEESLNGTEKVVEDLVEQIAALKDEMLALRQSSKEEAARLRSECEGMRAALVALENDRARFVSLAGKFRQQLIDVYASTSWRMTAPLRLVKSGLFGVDAAASVDFLPSPVVVHPQIVSTHSELSSEAAGSSTALVSPTLSDSIHLAPRRDLTWEEFNDRVFSRRDHYKGVFVQEIVIDWNVPLFQRPQHMASAFGRLGYLVLYRTINWTNDNVDGFREVAPNVWLTNSPQVDYLDNVVRAVYSTAYSDTFQHLPERSSGSVMVYEYIDHIDPQISGDEENIRRLLRLKDWAFSGGADVVVASARALEAEAVDAVGEARTILVQNGVDTRHYRSPTHAGVSVPQELHDFRDRFDTIVGYFGAIAPWLWYEAIADLVAIRPDVGFVFIGPDYYCGADRLPRSKNVLYLGAVDYSVLPGYARFFDVCFIPFEPGEIARTTSPLKLFEYFALEKPVVVTADMVECVAHPEVLKGRSAQEFSNAIDAAVAVKDDPDFRRRLAQLADENDWDCRAKVYASVFDLLEQKKH